MEAVMDVASRNLQQAVWKAGTAVYPESRYAAGLVPAFDQHKLLHEAGQVLISQSITGLVKALTTAGMPQPAKQMLMGLLALHDQLCEIPDASIHESIQKDICPAALAAIH